MNRRRFYLQKSGSQEHISLITIMFCFSEFELVGNTLTDLMLKSFVISKLTCNERVV